MIQATTVLGRPPDAVLSALPALLPTLLREGDSLFFDLDRHAVAELASYPRNGFALDKASQRWYPAFVGNIELDALPGGRTHLKITGVPIPGMGPTEDKRWEHTVLADALEALGRILERHFSHTELVTTGGSRG